jgi:hypothetical protein
MGGRTYAPSRVFIGSRLAAIVLAAAAKPAESAAAEKEDEDYDDNPSAIPAAE